MCGATPTSTRPVNCGSAARSSSADQRRSAFEGQLDRSAAIESLPNRQLQVEKHARGPQQHRRVALARIDAAALDRPQPVAIADAGPDAVRAPVRFPPGNKQRKQHDGRERSCPRAARAPAAPARLRPPAGRPSATCASPWNGCGHCPTCPRLDACRRLLVHLRDSDRRCPPGPWPTGPPAWRHWTARPRTRACTPRRAPRRPAPPARFAGAVAEAGGGVASPSGRP